MAFNATDFDLALINNSGVYGIHLIRTTVKWMTYLNYGDQTIGMQMTVTKSNFGITTLEQAWTYLATKWWIYHCSKY